MSKAHCPPSLQSTGCSSGTYELTGSAYSIFSRLSKVADHDDVRTTLCSRGNDLIIRRPIELKDPITGKAVDLSRGRTIDRLYPNIRNALMILCIRDAPTIRRPFYRIDSPLTRCSMRRRSFAMPRYGPLGSRLRRRRRAKRYSLSLPC